MIKTIEDIVSLITTQTEIINEQSKQIKFLMDEVNNLECRVLNLELEND